MSKIGDRSQAAFADAESERSPSGFRHWEGHVIVCGLEPVGLRTVEQLHLAGADVVVLDDEGVSDRHVRTVRSWGVPIVTRGACLPDSLFEAGLAGAEAVICIETTDLRTLETVLLARDLRPDVRLVAHLDNPAVARAWRRSAAWRPSSTWPRCSRRRSRAEPDRLSGTRPAGPRRRRVTLLGTQEQLDAMGLRLTPRPGRSRRPASGWSEGPGGWGQTS